MSPWPPRIVSAWEVVFLGSFVAAFTWVVVSPWDGREASQKNGGWPKHLAKNGKCFAATRIMMMVVVMMVMIMFMMMRVGVAMILGIGTGMAGMGCEYGYDVVDYNGDNNQAPAKKIIMLVRVNDSTFTIECEDFPLSSGFLSGEARNGQDVGLWRCHCDFLWHIRICYIMYSILYCIQPLILLIYFIFYCMVCIFRVTYESYLKLGITNSASSAILYVYRFFSWSMQCIQQIHTRKLMASKNEGRGRAAKKPRLFKSKKVWHPQRSQNDRSQFSRKNVSLEEGIDKTGKPLFCHLD